MTVSIVDRLHREFSEIVLHLGEAEISLRSTAEENFRKALLLAAASYFEKRICDDIAELVARCAGRIDLITEFVRTMAIERKYHTYFNWRDKNANSFFGLFGDGFKKYMADAVKADASLRESVTAFLEMGNDRNRLVHQDFGTFPLEKTSEEIFGLYMKASIFVESLSGHFESYLQQAAAASEPDEE